VQADSRTEAVIGHPMNVPSAEGPKGAGVELARAGHDPRRPVRAQDSVPFGQRSVEDYCRGRATAVTSKLRCLAGASGR
jgi:hypothetical protein